MRRLSALVLGLLLAQPALADMYQDASNAKLPDARANLQLTPTSALDIGFKTDGTTNNSAALAALFARTDSPTIYFPAGTYMLDCPTGQLDAASSVSMLGASAASTIIKLPPGCTIPADMLAWNARSGVRVSELTFDLNTPAPASSGRNVLFMAAYWGDVNGGSFDHLKIINGTSPIYLIAAGAAGGFTLQNFHIDDNYLHLTAPSTGTNQCIATTTVAGAGTITKISIDRNICVNSAIQSDGTYLSVSFNDVSGFNFGTGIFSPWQTSGHQTIIGNRIHDSGLLRDVNAVLANGIEVPQSSIICNNIFYNLGGPAIVNFGKYNLICNNIAYNNSNGVGAANEELAAYVTPLYGGEQFGGHTHWIGNKAWDDRATPKQIYGYYEADPGDNVPGISFVGNEFYGYGAGRAFRTVNPVSFGGTASVLVANLPVCTAGTKNSLVAVSDQLAAPTYRGPLTGGGTIAVLAFCNGATWEAH